MFHKSSSASLSRIRTVVEEKVFEGDAEEDQRRMDRKTSKEQGCKKTINGAGTRSSTGNHEC